MPYAITQHSECSGWQLISIREKAALSAVWRRRAITVRQSARLTSSTHLGKEGRGLWGTRETGVKGTDLIHLLEWLLVALEVLVSSVLCVHSPDTLLLMWCASSLRQFGTIKADQAIYHHLHSVNREKGSFTNRQNDCLPDCQAAKQM